MNRDSIDIGKDYAVRPKICRGGLVAAVGDEEEREIEVEMDAGNRKPKKMQDPKMPSQAEIEEHELTHLPFRSWCRH